MMKRYLFITTGVVDPVIDGEMVCVHHNWDR